MHRGDHFRTAFARLGELRSALRSDLPVLALTATSTKGTFDCIVKRLTMENVQLIGLSPNQDNIFLSVNSSVSLENFIRPIAEGIKKEGTVYAKSLIYCRSYNDCNLVFDQLEHQLGPLITSPPHFPKIFKYRMVDLFTRGSTEVAKEYILKDFIKADTHLRVIVATSAFGMGIDCNDIRQMFHWGPPHTIEEYIQEVGRGGRDKEQCYATLAYTKPRECALPDEVIAYGTNTSIYRRQLLYKSLLFYKESELACLCMCCDICSVVCECISCNSM